VSNKSHWCGQGGTNQSSAGGGKAHAFKAYQIEDQTKIQSGVCRKVFSFSKKPEKKIVKIVLLEPKLQLIKDLTISKGSFNVGIIQPRDFMTPTIRESATSFSLIHKHQSGKPTPRQKSFEVTDRLNQGVKIIGIHSVDHIIIGVNGFFSFADEGLL